MFIIMSELNEFVWAKISKVCGVCYSFITLNCHMDLVQEIIIKQF